MAVVEQRQTIKSFSLNKVRDREHSVHIENLPTIKRISELTPTHSNQNRFDANQWFKERKHGPTVYYNRKSGFSVWDRIPEGCSDDKMISSCHDLMEIETLPSPSSLSDIADLNEATLALSEILETEKAFVEHMGNLVEVYVTKIWNSLEIIPQLKDSRIIMFLNSASVVHKVHSCFLDALEEAKQTTSSSSATIDDQVWAFMKVFDYFHSNLLVAGEFVNVYGMAIEVFSELNEENQEFSSLMKRCKAYPVCRGHPLASLAMMPPQRCTRYILLLRQLLNKIEPGSPLHMSVEFTMKKYEELAVYVNERIRERENRERLAIAESYMITGKNPTLAIFGRRIVHEGPLGRIWRKSGGVQPCYFYLCNDVLIRTVVTFTGKHSINKIFPLNQLFAKKNPTIETDFFIDNENLIDLSDLLLEINTPEKSFLVIAGTINERDIWLEKLCNTKFQTTRPHPLADNFITLIKSITLSESTEECLENSTSLWTLNGPQCTSCDSKFTLFTRKYFCRRCGEPVCSTCHKGFIRHPVSGQKIRICRRCKVQGQAAIELNSINFAREKEIQRKFEHACKALSLKRFGAVNEDQHINIIDKIIVSEEAFVFCLEQALTSVIIPAYSSLLSKSSIAKMSSSGQSKAFKNVIDGFCAAVLDSFLSVYTIQKGFLKDLKFCRDSNGSLGKVLLRFSKMLPLLEDYQEAIMRMIRYGNESKLEEYYENSFLKTSGVSLGCLLRWPLTRLIMYLEDWTMGNIKEFDDDSELAIQNLRSVISSNRLKLSDAFIGETVSHIQKGYDPELKLPRGLQKNRKFVAEGFVCAQVFFFNSASSKHQYGTVQGFYYHLFSDLLILSSTSLFPNGFSMEHVLKLDEFHLAQHSWSKTRDENVVGSLQLSGRTKMVTILFYSKNELISWETNLRSTVVKI